MTDPFAFLVNLARLLGVLEFFQMDPRARPAIIVPGAPDAPPAAPAGDLDPEVARAIDEGTV